MGRKKDSEKAIKMLHKAVKKQLKKQSNELDLAELDALRCKQLAYTFVNGLAQQSRPARHTFPHHGVVLTKPWKGNPCKNCPALDGHLCKCALKQAKRVRLKTES